MPGSRSQDSPSGGLWTSPVARIDGAVPDEIGHEEPWVAERGGTSLRRRRDGRVDGLHPQALEVDHHEVVGGDTGAAGAADTQSEIAPVRRKDDWPMSPSTETWSRRLPEVEYWAMMDGPARRPRSSTDSPR